MTVLALLTLVATPSAHAARFPHDVVTGGVADDTSGASFTWNMTALDLTGDVDYANSTGYVEISALLRLMPTGVAAALFSWRVDIDGVQIPGCEATINRSGGQGQEIPYVEARCPYAPAGGEHTATFVAISNSNVNLESVTMVGHENLIIQGSENVNITTSVDAWLPYIILGLLFIAAVRSGALGVAFVSAIAILLTAAGNPWPVAAIAVFAAAAGLAWGLPLAFQERRLMKGGGGE